MLETSLYDTDINVNMVSFGTVELISFTQGYDMYAVSLGWAMESKISHRIVEYTLSHVVSPYFC